MVSTKEKVKVLAIGSASWIHDIFNLSILSLLAVPIMTEFNVNTGVIGAIMSGQFVAVFFGAFFFGWLADKFGRKPALILSVLWDSVFTALVFFAPNIGTFAALRIISGFGVSFGVASTMVSEAFGTGKRGLAGGIVIMTYVFGYIIAALDSALLYPLYGWRPCFLVALFPLPILVLAEFWLNESETWNSYRQHVEKVRVPIRDLFKGKYAKITLVAAILLWAVEFGYHGFAYWIPTMLERYFGYTTSAASGFMLQFMIVAIIVFPLMGVLSDRIGRRVTFFLCSILGLIAMTLFYQTTVQSGNLATQQLLLFVFAYGWNAVVPALLSELYPTNIRATAGSIIFGFARGLCIGELIVGTLAETWGLPQAMTITVIGFIFGVTLPWLLPETKDKILK